MRLDRLLSEMNIGSRSEIRAMVKAGRIRVNGAPVKDAGMNVSGQETITADGREVVYQTFEYYLLNKPSGVITATEDKRQKTVLDLLTGPHRKDVAPVGRLDKDTTGLLLLTNDGALAHRLLSPAHHVDKVYAVTAQGRLTEDDVRAFAQGLRVDDELTALPAELKIVSVEEAEDRSRPGAEETGLAENVPLISQALVTIREGKFHQVKRMFAAVGKPVLALKRLSMGPLTLDSTLSEGAYRPLTPEEIQALKN